ncbi:MAG TPA: hypothetical protein VIC62_03595, partial [Nakamurella sp.]
EADVASSPVDLGVECAMFLAGEYAGYLESEGRPVPAWAWLNRLAHGTEGDLRTLAGGPKRDGSPGGMISRIAGHVLELLESGDVSLPDLQRRTLIPLEMALGETPGPGVPLNSAELGRAIMHALSIGLSPLPPISGDAHP